MPKKLKYYFNVVGKAVGIKVNVLFTDGSQPIGRGLVHTGSYGCVECFAKRNGGPKI
jgi:hypothetical protein